MKATIKDVAALAGVSTATVDRVLFHRQGVHARTRERVWAAVRQLNYVIVSGDGEAVPTGGFDILIPSGRNGFMDRLEAGLLSRATSLGVHVRVHRQSSFAPGAISEALRALAQADAEQRTEGVALIAPDHPDVREAMRSLMAANVPVFTLVSDVSGIAHRGYIGIDNRSAGRLAGQLLGRFLSDRPQKVALFTGSPSYRGHEEREMGFRNILAEAWPHLEVVTTRETLDEDEQAARQLTTILESDVLLAGIYNIGAGSMGIAQTLAKFGKAHDTVFICHDLTEDNRPWLLQGAIDVIIDQNPDAEALSVLEALAAARAGRPPASPSLVPSLLILKENLPT